MDSHTRGLSKTEWRRLSAIATQIDWARYSTGQRYAELEVCLNDRMAAGLRQLLRTVQGGTR